MSDIVACPSCDRKLRVRPELQGHPVKCPSCATVFRPEEAAPPPPQPETKTPVPTRSHGDDEYEDDDRPRRRRRSVRDEEYDDEDDDRPRRRRRGQEPHRGTLVLVLGICGLLGLFWPITSMVAWILGSSDLRAIREGRMDPEGESNTRVGWILGIIGSVLFVLVVLFFCTIISIAVMAG